MKILSYLTALSLVFSFASAQIKDMIDVHSVNEPVLVTHNFRENEKDSAYVILPSRVMPSFYSYDYTPSEIAGKPGISRMRIRFKQLATVSDEERFKQNPDYYYDILALILKVDGGGKIASEISAREFSLVKARGDEWYGFQYGPFLDNDGSCIFRYLNKFRSGSEDVVVAEGLSKYIVLPFNLGSSKEYTPGFSYPTPLPVTESFYEDGRLNKKEVFYSLRIGKSFINIGTINQTPVLSTWQDYEDLK